MNGIRYVITPARPEAHLFRVTCTVVEPDPAGQLFRLPAWIPGSYMIREFARNVVSFAAESNGRSVEWRKVDKSTWQCDPVSGPLTVIYDVYAADLSVRGAHLDTTHAYFNGPAVFMAASGHEAAPCRVLIVPPAGDDFAGWQLATTLRPAADTAPWQPGEYLADDYDDLLDHPVEMGSFTRVAFFACGVPHDVVITGVHRCDTERLARDLAKICETQIRFFGEPAPMDRYLFLVTVVGEGYGGLEHRRSTSLIAARDDLPLTGDDPLAPKDAYRTFLGLCSHEYFHAWNVKRIKPEAFLPYDLAQENYTRQLWAFEGFTSYYDDLLLMRAGVITPESYLELLGQTITRVLRTPGRFRQSVGDASFDAWTRFYRQDENSPNAIVSYYAKGALVGLALDLELRRRTAGARSLDDLMRLLWQRYGLAGVGVPEDGIARCAAEIAGSDLREFFRLAVDGTDDLPLPELLKTVDVDWRLRVAESQADTGGKPGRGSGKPRPVLGVRTAVDALGAKLQHCYDGGAARAAGLMAGDVIVAVDGLRATHANLDKLLSSRVAGETVVLHAFRRDELRVHRATLQEPPADTCFLAFGGGKPSPSALRWLAPAGGVP